MRRTILVMFSAALMLSACATSSTAPPSPAPEGPAGEQVAEPLGALVSVAGASLPPIGPGGAVEILPAAERLQAPQLVMRTSEGVEVSVGPDAQRPQLLLFLAHWCPACQQEVPMVVESLAAGQLPEDVELVVVLTAFDPSRPNWPPLEWLQRERLLPAEAAGGSGPVRVVLDDAESSALRAFGLGNFPAWALLDSEGRVMSRFAGLVAKESLPTLLRAPSGS